LNQMINISIKWIKWSTVYQEVTTALFHIYVMDQSSYTLMKSTRLASCTGHPSSHTGHWALEEPHTGLLNSFLSLIWNSQPFFYRGLCIFLLCTGPYRLCSRAYRKYFDPHFTKDSEPTEQLIKSSWISCQIVSIWPQSIHGYHLPYPTKNIELYPCMAVLGSLLWGGQVFHAFHRHKESMATLSILLQTHFLSLTFDWPCPVGKRWHWMVGWEHEQ
jgi:hypothetical protein